MRLPDHLFMRMRGRATPFGTVCRPTLFDFSPLGKLRLFGATTWRVAWVRPELAERGLAANGDRTWKADILSTQARSLRHRPG